MAHSSTSISNPIPDHLPDHPAAPVLAALQQATSVAEVRAAARQIDTLVVQLHRGGAPVEAIAQRVCSLNAQVFARLWGLLAPAHLVAGSCLVVMGSEGRGEQIFKTDQDNALLLRDEADAVGLEALALRFIDALIDCGYPRCPGDIMLSNPLWRQPVAGFRQTLVTWMFGADPQGPMRLAIFIDAVAVAGDAALLEQARDFVYSHSTDNDAFLARFARAADQFDPPGGWWRRLGLRGAREAPPFDLKKLGSFPIVHGVRALALQHRIMAVSTLERLRGLVDHAHLPHATATALAQALHRLMVLKLEHNLRQRERGELMDNQLRPSELGAAQRTELDEVLAVVKGFRHMLREHFRLDAL